MTISAALMVTIIITMMVRAFFIAGIVRLYDARIRLNAVSVSLVVVQWIHAYRRLYIPTHVAIVSLIPDEATIVVVTLVWRVPHSDSYDCHFGILAAGSVSGIIILCLRSYTKQHASCEH